MMRVLIMMCALLAAAAAQAQPAFLSPRDTGAQCDGHTDDSAALRAWWSHLMERGVTGLLPAGLCVSREPLTWDLSARANGIRIEGAGQGQSVLDLRAVRTSPALRVTGSKALFYTHLSDFTVLADTAGPGVQLGRPDLKDALNGFTLTQIEFKNAARDDAAIALQVNGCFNCDFQTVTTNTGGGSVTGTGKGVSLQIRHAAFSRFMGSFSGAGIGLHLTDGYIFANTFQALDIEVVNTALRIDSAKAERNTVLGGQFVAMTGLDFAAGSANLVQNPNISPYQGGTPLGRTVGLWLEQPGTGVATPPVPPSGAAVVNATGRPVLVQVFGGSVSRILVGSSAYPVQQGSVMVAPNETIALTYGARPNWEWRPVR